MWARVARFEGDPGNVDAAIEEARGFAASGDVPPELVGAKMLMLVDRQSGARLMVAMFRHRGRDAQRRRCNERWAASQRWQALIGRVLRGSWRDSALTVPE
jgi:hypothetical protein